LPGSLRSVIKMLSRVLGPVAWAIIPTPSNQFSRRSFFAHE
jgi:hypothetical protein